MSTVKVRPAILRRYYEASFAGQVEAGYADASFEELAALLRITIPGIHPWTVASRAAAWGHPEYESLAGALERPPPPDSRTEVERLALDEPVARFRGKTVELPTALAGTKARVLEFERCDIIAWRGLEERRDWRHLALRQCTTDDPIPASPRRVSQLRIVDSSPRCLQAALGSLIPEEAQVTAFEGRLDAAILTLWEDARHVFLSAPAIDGLESVRKSGLVELSLAGVPKLADAWHLCNASASTLRKLGILTHQEFLPRELPDFKGLSHLTVYAYPSLRAEWLEFACRMTDISVMFVPMNPPVRRRLRWGVAPGTSPAATSSAPSKRAKANKSKRLPARRLSGWEGLLAPRVLNACRRILQAAEAALSVAGVRVPAQRAILKQAVSDLNQLNAKKPFIGTVEAEDLVNELREIAAKTRIAGVDASIDKWRNF